MLGPETESAYLVDEIQSRKIYRDIMSSSSGPVTIGIIICLLSILGCSDPAEDKLKTEFETNKAKAEQGDTRAQFNLAKNYERGLGVKADYSMAIKWYSKAAENGDAQAQNNLGMCYEAGRGVAKNSKQAFFWYLKSAEQGADKAQFNLGLWYQYAIGEDKNYHHSAYWYRKSAEQGNALAQAALAGLYLSGKGVEKDFSQSVYWYRKAAEQGDSFAQLQLGFRFANGEGVKQDVIEAYAYLSLAGKTDNDNRNSAKSVEIKMTPDQIAAGKKRMKELQEEIDAKKAGK